MKPSDQENLNYPIETIYKASNDEEPNLIFNVSVGLYESVVVVNIKERIVNNATEYCPLSNFTIHQVVNVQNQVPYEPGRYEQFVEMDLDARIYITSLTKVLDYKIFVSVNNSAFSATVSNSVLGVSIYQPVVYLN